MNTFWNIDSFWICIVLTHLQLHSANVSSKALLLSVAFMNEQVHFIEILVASLVGSHFMHIVHYGIRDAAVSTPISHSWDICNRVIFDVLFVCTAWCTGKSRVRKDVGKRINIPRSICDANARLHDRINVLIAQWALLSFTWEVNWIQPSALR